MYTDANQNVKKMLEPINLAVKKLRVLQDIERIERELETAEKELERVTSFIENAEENLYKKSDNFNVTFTGYGNDEENGNDSENGIELGEIGPLFSVREFVSQYVSLMRCDKEASRIKIKISLNNDSLALNINDKETKEEFGYECD